MDPPPIEYAKTLDGVYIAYQVRGAGPVDLVYIMGFAGNFEIEFESPWGNRFLERLSVFSRVILFDKRGTGLSDRVVATPDLDARADDLRAVLDAAGSERAVLVGDSEGGALAAFFAATHPDRVLALILLGSGARVAWAPDYPLGISTEDRAAERGALVEGWGSIEKAMAFLGDEAPTHANDPEWIRWAAKAERHSASPSAASRSRRSGTAPMSEASCRACSPPRSCYRGLRTITSAAGTWPSASPERNTSKCPGRITSRMRVTSSLSWARWNGSSIR